MCRRYDVFPEMEMRRRGKFFARLFRDYLFPRSNNEKRFNKGRFLPIGRLTGGGRFALPAP